MQINSLYAKCFLDLNGHNIFSSQILSESLNFESLAIWRCERPNELGENRLVRQMHKAEMLHPALQVKKKCCTITVNQVSSYTYYSDFIGVK